MPHDVVLDIAVTLLRMFILNMAPFIFVYWVRKIVTS